MCTAKSRYVHEHVHGHGHGHIMNGDPSESHIMNELWDKPCCLCHLSSKGSRKRKRLHRTSCTKAKVILANLTTVSLRKFHLMLSDCYAILCNG